MSIDPKNLNGTAVLTFSEEFDGNSLNSSVWNTAYPWNAANGGTNLSNKEEQWYINENYGPTAALAADTYQVKDGMLHIKAQPTPAGYKQHVDGYNYTSGMITTHSTFEQKYGYFEMRADIPSGKGMWPAFWLLQPGKWPPEIDIMEVIGSRPDHLELHVHYMENGQQRQGTTVHYPGLSDGFQTYGVNWQADTITWYLNGEKVFEVDTPPDLHDPMYMLVNLAVGGSWPGSPDANTQFPATMKVDYVRAYSEMPEGMVPPPAIPEPEEEVAIEDPAVEEELTDEVSEDEADEAEREEAGKVDPEVEEIEETDEAGIIDEAPESEEPVEDEPVEEEPEEEEPEEEPIAEEETPVEEADLDETPIVPDTSTGNGRYPASWDKFIEAFAGFGNGGSGNDGWSKMADKFAAKAAKFDAKADKFAAKAEEFAAKKAGVAEKMLAKKAVLEADDAASDFFASVAPTSTSSGRDMSKLFKGNGFEVSNAKLDFGSQRMDAFNDRVAAFQEKGMGSHAQKFQDLNMGDFDLSKTFAEGIADQAMSPVNFDFV